VYTLIGECFLLIDVNNSNEDSEKPLPKNIVYKSFINLRTHKRGFNLSSNKKFDVLFTGTEKNSYNPIPFSFYGQLATKIILSSIIFMPFRYMQYIQTALLGEPYAEKNTLRDNELC